MAHFAVLVLAIVCAFVASQQNYTETPITTDTTIFSETVPPPVPTKPLNLSVLSMSSNTINLRWIEPERANGVIVGYFIYYSYENFTEVKNVKILTDLHLVHSQLLGLRPFTNYSIFVQAYTDKYNGDHSDSVTTRTDICGPDPPKLVNLTCLAQETIFLHWERPKYFFETLDYYYIYVFIDTDFPYDNITIPTNKEHLEVSYSIKNVTTNALYRVGVSAATYSRYTGRIVHGNLSVLKQIYVQTDCDKIQQYLRNSNIDLGAGIIAGIGCAVFAFVLAISAFVLWRKCVRASYYYLDDIPCSVHNNALEWNTPPTTSDEHKGAISTDTFHKHVSDLHADGDIGFSKEYDAIQNTSEEYPSEHSKNEENRTKNRYLNIIAYDHSRVPLLQMPGQKKTIDYINANYIDGFQRLKAYIGTQGPLPSTFDCFWRMVWEQRVTIIVMITNLVERGRRKCDMYWPKEGIETYGIIQVRLLKEDITATYTVRTLLIKHLRIKKKKPSQSEKVVFQYHYTNWPDHGTPDHALPVIHFINKSSSANPPESGPIVVHCSAGVGRTGTYIVLDAMLKQIRSRNEVNIFGFLRHIRSQRNFLVQTEEQYIFIHDALLEAIESGETNISRENIPRHVQMLQNRIDSEKITETWNPLELQYRMMTSFKCQEFNLVSANKVINQPKNRGSIVSVESSRVHLTPKPGEDGSDYVNATWMQGFQNLREYIITQHPIPNTFNDFWQMVWDHNAQTIIMLSIVDNQEYQIFWPPIHESIDTENYKIIFTREYAQSLYITREFTMQSLQDDYELHVRMVHCQNWPHHCSSISEIFHLGNTIFETRLGYQNGPTVVIDKFGGPEAATYCCLTALKRQLAYENHADVYMYAKLYHNKRPGIWPSVADYMRLHLAVQLLCSSDGSQDLFAVANGSASCSMAVATTSGAHMSPEGDAVS